jgi:hypothetical protein
LVVAEFTKILDFDLTTKSLPSPVTIRFAPTKTPEAAPVASKLIGPTEVKLPLNVREEPAIPISPPEFRLPVFEWVPKALIVRSLAEEISPDTEVPAVALTISTRPLEVIGEELVTAKEPNSRTVPALIPEELTLTLEAVLETTRS